MKTVEQLIRELEAYPQDALAAAYSAEWTGIVIYKPEHGTFSIMDHKSDEADESIGYIDLYYDDKNRPPIQ